MTRIFQWITAVVFLFVVGGALSLYSVVTHNADDLAMASAEVGIDEEGTLDPFTLVEIAEELFVSTAEAGQKKDKGKRGYNKHKKDKKCEPKHKKKKKRDGDNDRPVCEVCPTNHYLYKGFCYPNQVRPSPRYAVVPLDCRREKHYTPIYVIEYSEGPAGG